MRSSRTELAEYEEHRLRCSTVGERCQRAVIVVTGTRSCPRPSPINQPQAEVHLKLNKILTFLAACTAVAELLVF